MKNRLKLYLVTNRNLSSGRTLEEVVTKAAEGGVTMVQLREKEASTSEFIELALRVKRILKPYNIPLIINDRIDVALAVDADGVHIGQSDMPYEVARRLVGANKIIGLSVENMDDLLKANELDVDYIGISPVFSTPTKTDTAKPFGIEGLKEAVKLSIHPTVAIGGMNISTAADVMATGCDGIAVVSAISSAADITNAAAELRAIVEHRRKRYHRVLTIAGSDSGGGAGIQADIKAISALGCFATTAITAITAQNTLGVTSVHPIPLNMVGNQIDAVLSDIGTDTIKIGMLHSAEVVEIVANKIEQYGIKDVVLDPVMVSTSGHRLIEERAVEVLKSRLMPLARIITPNIPEAEILAGVKITSESQFANVARLLSNGGQTSVLLKAGHLSGDILTDYLYNAEDGTITTLPSARINTKNTHGTGCTLSSALAAALASGFSLTQAAKIAKHYIEQAIISGAEYTIGDGHGAVDHFWDIRKYDYLCRK